MTNAELIAKIKAELERLKNDWASLEDELTDAMVAEYDYLLDFLSTLESEKPVPKDLEEAAEEYIKKGKYLPEGFVVRPAFIAGAEWQMEQMMKEAVDMTLCNLYFGNHLEKVLAFGNRTPNGKTIRIIIVKEDEK